MIQFPQHSHQIRKVGKKSGYSRKYMKMQIVKLIARDALENEVN